MSLTLLVVLSPAAFSQSDAELLEKVRANAAQVALEQASFTLPESFHSSGLAHSDKQRLIEKWANDVADCHADTLSVYADDNDIALSELIADDGTYGFRLGVPTSWEVRLDSCLARAWETIGAAQAN